MSGPRGPGLLAALVALPLLLAAATVPTGPPRSLPGPSWDGLGWRLDAWLPGGGGWVVTQRLVRVDGEERVVVQQARVGDELAACLTYALGIGLGLVALGRLGGVPRLRLTAIDRRALLDALAALVPLWSLVAIGAALAARVATPLAVKAAVYGWCLPLLGRPTTAVWPLLRLVILAPLAEELLWRGLVFRGLRSRWPLAPAAVATALAFGLWHWLSGWQSLGALSAQYAFGLVACLLVERSGGLGAALALHALGNACVAVLYAVCLRWPEHVLGALGQ